MGSNDLDPTEAMRLQASQYPGVDEGTACTQSAFRTGKQAFLYVGMQGGRYKAMFKLDKSRAEASRLAAREPDRFQVGSTSWVTARFSAEQPMPRTLWKKWLDESYGIAQSSGSKVKTKTSKTTKKAKSPKKTKTVKHAANKKVASKPTRSKKTKKKSTSKKSQR